MLAVTQDSELDRGATAPPRRARTCALTRELLPVESLLRFVVSPDGEVVPDLKRKLPGRGLWITATRAALEEAVARKVFARGFKREVRVAATSRRRPSGCWRVRRSMRWRSPANPATSLTGFSKVEAALAHGEAVALIHASDAAADGKRKLDAALQRETAEKSREIAVIEEFSGEPIGFGIEPPKCGTCSPACRARERDISRPRRAFSALSDRPIARCS